MAESVAITQVITGFVLYFSLIFFFRHLEISESRVYANLNNFDVLLLISLRNCVLLSEIGDGWGNFT